MVQREESTPIREEDVQGLKYFGKLGPLLARLHDVGCQRDKAGNRPGRPLPRRPSSTTAMKLVT